MNFPQNEPNSNPTPGIGSIRTMQGDLKNIRASKNKAQGQTNAQQQPKPQTENQVWRSFGASNEPVIKKPEPILDKNIPEKRTDVTNEPQSIIRETESIREPVFKKAEPQIVRAVPTESSEIPRKPIQSIRKEAEIVREKLVIKKIEPVLNKEVVKDEGSEVSREPVKPIIRETESIREPVFKKAEPQIVRAVLTESPEKGGVWRGPVKPLEEEMETDRNQFVYKKVEPIFGKQATNKNSGEQPETLKQIKKEAETISKQSIIEKEEESLYKRPISTIKKEPVKEPIADKVKKEPKSGIVNESNIEERIRQLKEKIKPFGTPKEVSAPENIVKVSEPENKVATQYVESLSKSAQSTDADTQEESVNRGINEEEEYLPPELRLYRSTGSVLANLKKDSAKIAAPRKPEIKSYNPADKMAKENVFSSGIKIPVNKSRIMLILIILIIAIGAYLVFTKRVNLEFLSKWLPNTPAVTPTATPSLSPVVKDEINIKDTISIKDKENLIPELFSLKNKGYSRINVVSVSMNGKAVEGDDLFNQLNIFIPANVRNNLNINNSYLLYFADDNRLGLIFEIKESSKDQLTKEMKVWSEAQIGSGINPMAYTLSPLLLGNFFELGQNITFKSANYRDTTINYSNLPDTKRSIDYAILNKYMIIVTSKDDMSLAIDELIK